MMDTVQAPLGQTRDMLLGSDAVAWGARLCRPDVIAAYPITPQTHIIETLSGMVDGGELSSEYIKAESEMSALAACYGAVASGSRSFTATSSHGLALMHEMLHWFSGSRFPMVLVNANRALGAPWNIWTDQGDSLSQRDTGWLQIYCETAQEALDSTILAYWLSERIMLPVMVMIDGFILSHTMEQLMIPDQERVDAFLPRYEAPYRLDTENPLSFGAAATPDNFYELRKALAKTMRASLRTLEQGYADFREHFGRTYDNLIWDGPEDADTVLLCSGSVTGTVRTALEELRKEGHRTALIKLRLVRPFPRDELMAMLSGVRRLIVLNRAVSFGAGGTLTQEVRSALFTMPDAPSVIDVIASLGGKEIFPETIRELVLEADQLSERESNWF
ncbi:MAG: transketolase C-terminal domain-containing protein [Desulfohalobiaceae bacterium]